MRADAPPELDRGHAGRRTGTAFAYTRPSPGHYPWQWFWDSCFAAIVWRRFDPARARTELETLLAAQREDGFIGHTIFWNDAADRASAAHLQRDLAVRPDDREHPAADARVGVADRGRGPARRSRGIARHHEWLAANRDLDGDGLIWIVQPDESGLDASPQFDPIWRGRAHARPGFVLLVRRNRRLGYDLRQIVGAGGPVCCEVMTNVLYGLSRLALGQPSLTPTIVERMYDEERGPVLAARAARRRAPAAAHLDGARAARAAGPARGDRPAAGRGAPARPSALLARRSRPRRSRPTIRASRSEDTGARSLAATGAGRPGSTRSWLVWLGLVRLGYAEQAAELARRAQRCWSTRAGLREYYDPYTGAGMGATASPGRRS